MKYFFIILLLLSSWIGCGKTTSQKMVDRCRRHIVCQLACQAPPHYPPTGIVVGSPTPVYKKQFGKNEEVWAAVAPNAGGRNYAGQIARLYVVEHNIQTPWLDNTPLEDASGKYEIVEIQPGCPNNNYVRIWKIPEIRAEGYDVIVDFAPFGIYNKGIDMVDGLNTEGFLVPRLWICLESITFNRDKACDIGDGINIRKNIFEEIHVPEWEKGKKNYPAAYTFKNKKKVPQIHVKAVFSAAPGIKNVNIKAVECQGKLGDVIERQVPFNNRTSVSYDFQVSGMTEEAITSFYQEWKWVCRNINGNSSDEFHIGTTRNKIYVLLTTPQSPWTRTGPTAPWTDVLEKACLWAEGETTAPAAAKQLTSTLYHDLGGFYNKAPSYTGSTKEGFELMGFLEKIPAIGNVNCFDMGKALVIFSNALGCGLTYRYLSLSIHTELNCIKKIGERSWDCFEKFKSHSFGSIGHYIYDASLKLVADDEPHRKDNMEELVAGKHWCLYKEKFIKSGRVVFPGDNSFPIDLHSMGQGSRSLAQNIEAAKIKYDYPKWPTTNRNPFPSLKRDLKLVDIHPELTYLRKVWENERYIIENFRGICYSTIRKRWKSKQKKRKDILDIKIIWSPTIEAAKEYLIHSYADTSAKSLPERKRWEGIGDICLAKKVMMPRSSFFSNVDFICNNILIMISAQGSIRNKKVIQAIARNLEHHLTDVKEKLHMMNVDNENLLEIKCFPEKKYIGVGTSVPLHLTVYNQMGGALNFLWEVSGGGVEKNSAGNFLYYASEEGRHRVTVIVLNDYGLRSEDSIEIQVISVHKLVRVLISFFYFFS